MRDLRQVNRSAVLRPLFLQGPLNRVALGRLTGLSSGSVTNVTAALLDEGLITEVGLEESDGGRPRVLLQVNPEFGAVIGVEVGETRIRVEGFDLRMRVAGVADVGLHPQHHPAQVAIEQIVQAVEKLKAQFSAEGRRLLGVGIAVPGIVDHRQRRRLGTCAEHRLGRRAARAVGARASRPSSSPRTAPRRWGRPRCGWEPVVAPVTLS